MNKVRKQAIVISFLIYLATFFLGLLGVWPPFWVLTVVFGSILFVAIVGIFFIAILTGEWPWDAFE